MEGKEIKQVAQELGVSIPAVTKWRVRFSLFGIRGLNDQQRSGKLVTYEALAKFGPLTHEVRKVNRMNASFVRRDR